LKLLFTIFVSSVITLYSNAQTQKTKLFTLVKNDFFLCGEHILLDSLGYFFREKDCEGTAYISYGRYKILQNDVIQFDYLPFDSLELIKETRHYGSKNYTGIVSVTLYDRENKLLLSSFNIRAVDKSGQQTAVHAEKGKIKIDPTKYESIFFMSLMSIYKYAKSVYLNSEFIDVHFALPNLFLVPFSSGTQSRVLDNF
jgi:hypothetical protein